MTVINDTWRFLVQRKLWPVAILLVAAAAAVPMLLGKQPSAPAAPASTAAVKSDDSTLTTQPIVALASDGDRAGRRHVLGSPKDPFKPNATPTPTPKPQNPSSASVTGGAAPANSTTTPAGTAVTTPGSPVGAPSVPGFTTPLAPVTPKKHYELYELTVRFGASADATPERKDVKRLEALPSADEPVLIYLGVLKDQKTAVFMVDSGVDAQGDGTCKPSRATCETIQLKEGDTEFFDVPSDSGDGSDSASATPSAQYELDVVKIRKTTTTSAKQANKSLARVSKAGRQILRARIAGDGPLHYRYDKTSGQLEALTSKAYKAVVAKVAKVAEVAKVAKAAEAAKAAANVRVGRF
jgi:hypothetical protein